MEITLRASDKEGCLEINCIGIKTRETPCSVERTITEERWNERMEERKSKGKDLRSVHFVSGITPFRLIIRAEVISITFTR